jgi:hypothetical protein
MVWFIEHQAAELVVVHRNGVGCVLVDSMTVDFEDQRASKVHGLVPH